MRAVLAASLTIGLAAGAQAAIPVRTGADLAQTCQAFAAHPAGYNRTPEGLADPCRKFLEGFLRTLKDKSDAELKARAEDVRNPKPAGPCVRMPDVLTYREFAQRIANFSDAKPEHKQGSALDLAQKTLENDFPCPEPERPR